MNDLFNITKALAHAVKEEGIIKTFNKNCIERVTPVGLALYGVVIVTGFTVKALVAKGN